jgi:hypothetical protein
MPRITTSFQSFRRGELTPKLEGRYDLETAYKEGVSRLENYISSFHGGASYRNGFRFVAATKGDNLAKLIPFASIYP